ncbi:hypothetical protein GALMADRAFT_242230 [Galerina marginata CBS 339.88]|uniref:DUF6534 domain-containing protein n=1 Tax=Galerina marginata (strain CBS 339.88) TaxID=685588 RepID=A0A067TA05_GALM3|nr:hypothetical protein GALMADRAFT_242230 [Galerina marginata CBS 339.88]
MTSVIKATFSYSTGFDIVLAGSMCYYLNKTRNRTCFRPTSNRIASIMRYILISGTITSATSLAILICYIIMPENLIFLGITFIVTKVYINSYMALLNARSSTRGRPSPNKTEGRITYLRSDGGLQQRKTASSNHKGDEIHSDSFQLSSVSTHSGADTTLGVTQSEPPCVSIQIHHTEERRVDEGTQYSSQV